ncbi:UDP-N-acetylglucosamine 4,6-dehydratase family protein [Methanococcoides burtonii]|uniref:Polysaccharide biosynthesis protein CapD n=1 Tax=Methanococcoides burtonii (strain DSM 6242 / NBRC 107633 / OCM 468 / ACE-M) TaxID=259564 RepID=Q12VN1_METBU|nr:UDP-N-acetylglucosamine 4,6-dehydratase family protein [Methanococcoides burtonii]ABE52495.1 Polysaccharide biosynthesis protein CapD [Methanococcoides burtonii DSM 6242]
MKDIFKNKNILVTGGTGSIGSEIVRLVLRYNPKVVRILSRDESKQFELEQEIGHLDNVRFLIGDIRDKSRLQRAFEGIDIVFHAAAMKHVPACEYNPFEAVKTNVMGTQNVIDAALDNDIEKVIAISTDKAASPINTMGATKLLAEKLILDANFYKGPRKTVFSCVRFGNVMGSRGSVIPLFAKQIKNGGPVTVTDSEMTRFMMSIPQAVNLVFKATKIARGGEIFIFKMPVVKLGDLAQVMIEKLAPKYGYKPEDIQITNIGIRNGEKMYEHLMNLEEALYAYKTEDMYIVLNKTIYSDYFLEGIEKAKQKVYSSDNVKVFTQLEIKDLLNSAFSNNISADDI